MKKNKDRYVILTETGYVVQVLKEGVTIDGRMDYAKVFKNFDKAEEIRSKLSLILGEEVKLIKKTNEKNA